MNLKRALWVGALTYITSFIIGMVPLLFIDIDITDASSLPQSFFIVGIILSVILATLFTLLYFRDRKIKRNAKEGFYFGLVLIGIGFTFDLATGKGTSEGDLVKAQCSGEYFTTDPLVQPYAE